LEHKHPFILQDVRHLAVWVQNIAELPRAGGTDFETRRIATRPRALDAKVTFFHDSLVTWTVSQVSHVRIDLVLGDRRSSEVEAARPVRAGSFAVTAPDAPIVINHGDPIGFLPGGIDRTDFDAGRILALMTLHRHVKEPLLG